MGCKCKGSLPHAPLSWRPLLTSASIYMRKNNKKFAALANKANPHIIMCATVVHFHIPCGGDERAPGCWKHHTRPATLRSSNIKKSALSQQLPWVLEPVVQPTVAWSQEPAGNKSGSLLHTQPNQGSLLMPPSWLRARWGYIDLLPFMPATGWPGGRHSIRRDIREGCRNPVVTPWVIT